ncbi:hypothetical protein D3C77_774120 [compost metagenome]
MLCHGAAGGGNHESRSGRDIEDVRPIATGADHIDDLIKGVEFNLVSQLAHH